MRTACPWPWKLHNSRLAQGGAVFGGGGKSGSGGTTYQTQATTIPPEVRARYDAVNARAEQVAQQPFQPYTGQFVAPMTSTQQAGIQQIAQAGQGYQPYQQAATTALTGAAEAALPYYGQAGQNISAAQAAGAPYTGLATMAGLAGTQAVNAQPLQIGQYMDPYIQSVVTPTMQGLYQQQQQQQSQLMGSQAMRGAFGGDRGAIAAANLARQQGLAAQQAQAGLLSGAYGQALTAAQQQQGVGLQAAQANRAALQQFSPQALQIGQQAFQQPMATAQAQQGLGQGLLGYGQGVAGSLAGLGQQGTQTGLASGQALLGAGTLQQQTQQQLNAALYNQYLQQQGYPFQVAQFLANIALGTGPLYGSTTTGVTGQPTPFFSDERVKEDIVEIGRTHDGQKIIKFRYKGEPEGTSHIGLSAQDVEKHHPEAVSETPEGIKAVDYDAATKHAERAYGGLVPSSEGGAVHPSMAGLGFAAGGVPVPGASPEDDRAKQNLMPHLPGLAPRMAFTPGGTVPGVDDRSQAILAALNPGMGTLPHGSFGSLPGRALGNVKMGLSVPRRTSPLGADGSSRLPPPPQPGKTGLGQAIDTAKEGVSLYNTGEALYKGGEKAYDWFKKQAANQQPAQTGYAAANAPGQIKSETLAAPAPAPEPAPAPAPAPAPRTAGLAPASTETQTAEATGLAPAVEEAPTMLADAAEPLSEGASALGEGGLDMLSMFAARGGRIHRNPGGGLKTNLPFSEASGEYVPEDLTATEPTPKLDEPKMNMQAAQQKQQKDKTASTALGLAGLGASFIPGVGPFLGAGLKAASMFAARGGAMDYESVVERGESGGRNVRNTASGAGGYFQFMPATWAAARRALPHLPADVMDATKDQQREALNWLNSEHRGALRSSLGRDPSSAEMRYAHHFGPAGAAALLKLDPGTRFADLPPDFWHKLGEKFDTATLLRQNPHLREETTGGLMSKYSRDFGGAPPPAETHLAAASRSKAPGLAPPMDFEDEEPVYQPEENRDFELPVRFAAYGGLVPRHGYQAGGSPNLDPDVAAQLAEELSRRTTPMPPEDTQGGMPARSATPDETRAAADRYPGLGNPMPPEITQGATPARDATADERRAVPSRATGVAPPLPAPAPVATAGGANPPAVGLGTGFGAGAAATTPPVELPKQPNMDPSTPGFFDKAGFFDRNKDWILSGAAGIGKMLASRSPYLLPAIGEGLTEAAQMYPALGFKQQGLDIQQQQADIASARQLYTVYKDTLGRINSMAYTERQSSPEAKALEDQANMLGKYISSLLGKYPGLPKSDLKILADVNGGARGAPSGATPGAPIPISGAPAPGAPAPGAPAPGAPAPGAPAPGAPAPGAPAPGATTATTIPQPPPLPISMRAQQTAPSMFNEIPDERNPLKIVEKAQRMAGTADPSLVIGLYNQAAQIEQNWAQTGRYQDKDGVSRIVPGWLENKMQDLRGTKNVEYFDREAASARARTGAQATVDDLQAALEAYQSGYFDEYLGKANAALAALNYPPITDKKDPAQYQRFLKDTYALIFNQLGALGGQPLKTEMEGLAKTVPTATLDPRANKILLTNIKAALDHETKLFTDQVAAASQNPGAFDPATFYAQWSQRPENKISTMKQQISRELAVRGVTPTGAPDEIGMRFIVEPTRENGLSRPMPMYLAGYERDPNNPKMAYPIYKATR